MTIGVGNLILASDYTAIKATVDAIYSAGSGQSGYGQTITSTVKTSGNIISQVEWNALRNDMIACRQHQTGITVGSLSPTDPGYIAGENLIIPTITNVISQTITQQYADFANTITTDKFLVNSGQQSTYGLNSQVRTTEWNNIIAHSVTVTQSIDNLRYFFNSGGTINFTASRTGGSGTTKDTDWSTMLSNMGTISINHSSTVSSTSIGTGTSIGFYNLTTTDQLIYQQSGTTFTANKYYIYARVDNVTTPANIIFTIDFEDLDTSGADINVTGTLTSVVTQTVATGANVAVSQLTASASSLTGGVLVPSYSISASTTTVTQGNSVTLNVHASQLPDGSSLTYSIAGGIVDVDFTPNTLTGGPFVLDSSGNYSFTLTMSTYLTNQDLKTFTVNLLDNGVIVASTAAVSIPPKGTLLYTVAGPYSWIAPVGATSVSIVAIGGGGGANEGRAYGSSWGQEGHGGCANNVITEGAAGADGQIITQTVSITSGNTYFLTVGAGGIGGHRPEPFFFAYAPPPGNGGAPGSAGGNSSFDTVVASGGAGGAGGTPASQSYGMGGISSSGYGNNGNSGAVSISWD